MSFRFWNAILFLAIFSAAAIVCAALGATIAAMIHAFGAGFFSAAALIIYDQEKL